MKKNQAAVSLGRLGGKASGQVKSDAKALASRLNGRKGGLRGSITVDGVRYTILRDGRVTAPPDHESATPFERQWWWESHPFAKEIRELYEQRANDRLVAKMCREMAGRGK